MYGYLAERRLDINLDPQQIVGRHQPKWMRYKARKKHPYLYQIVVFGVEVVGDEPPLSLNTMTLGCSLASIDKSETQNPGSAAAYVIGYCCSCSRVQNFIVDGDGTLSRPTPLLLFGGVRDNSSQLKLRSNVRYLSSADLPSHTVIGMPALSPTMTQGNIAKWRKKEGDKVSCIESWFLAKIMVPEGSKDVPVGQPIAITVEEAEDIQKVPATVAGESEVEEKKLSQQNVGNEDWEQETSSVKISASELPPHVVLEMPALSPTMNQGNIAKWRKKEGDKIQVGDVICEIETDKATLEFECLEEGFLAKILAPEGSKDMAMGQPIAITVEEPNDLETVKTSFSGNWMGKEEKPTHHEAKHEGRTQKISFTRISPSAKLLILEHGLDASSFTASGPRGTLTKGDVLAAIKSGKSSPKISSSLEKMPPSPQIQPQTSSESAGLRSQDSYEDLPNSQNRKVPVLGAMAKCRVSKHEKVGMKIRAATLQIMAKAWCNRFGGSWDQE
ncbi:unnamed protein product [Ilex paraguariensis]|uniref:Uncharacterized protein n=1 Tax=Ilex paraguariensis TaxID=185542 RepID=A0ABC8U2M4_9AQUA